MELFAVEVARQEVSDLLGKETALSDAKKFSLKSVIEKTVEMTTLTKIKSYLIRLNDEKMRVANGIAANIAEVYQEEARKMMKEIEADYQKIQREELKKLMNQL